MIGQNQTRTEIEIGGDINRDNVADWDTKPTDERYKALNTSPRHTRAGQEGYLLKDGETGAIHIANLDTNISQPNYHVNAANIRLAINGHDVTSYIIDDLSRGVEYNHYIGNETVWIEYHGESGWPNDSGDGNWDVVADVITE